MTDEGFTRTFLSNLENIFIHSKNDIITKLNEKSPEFDGIRKELRQQLLTEMGKVLPDYSHRTPINRIKQKGLCEDIFILGYCIVQKTIHEDLEKVYKKEQVEPQLRVEDLDQVIMVVTELRTKLNKIDKDYAEYKEKSTQEITELTEYKEKSTQEITELKSEIRRMTANNQAEMPDIEQENQNEAREPDMPTGNQVPNILLEPNQSPQPASSNISNPEDSQHHETTFRPVTAAPKVTDIFIGCSDSELSCADIQEHIQTKTNLRIKIEDIQEINSTNGRKKKAFKVTVPQNKFLETTSIWPNDVKAERYVTRRPKHTSPQQGNARRRNSGYNRNNTQNYNNNRHNNNGNNRNRNNQTNSNNRQNGGNQNQGGNQQQQTFQNQGQNNQGSHPNGQHLQTQGNFPNFSYGLPPLSSVPWIPYPNWNPNKTAGWPLQPSYNF